MVSLAAEQARPRRLAVYGYAELDQSPGWEARLCWPVAPGALRALGDKVCRTLLGLIAAERDPLVRDALLVASVRMVNPFMVLAEAALAADAEARGEIELIGGPPELAALRDANAVIAVTEDRHRGKGVLDVAPQRWSRLRSSARTASWTAPQRLPLTLLAPEAVAISHNVLLRDHARRTGRRVGFAHGANILFEARRRSASPAAPEAVMALPTRVIDALLAFMDALDEPYRLRLRRLYLARLEVPFRRIAADVMAMRTMKRLPRAMWSGTGSAYATRVIAVEVRRRDGRVTGFDHGGVTGISQLLPLSVLGELGAASTFVVGTPAWAELLARSDMLTLAKDVSGCTLDAAQGEPTFRAACLDVPIRRGARRRVIYVCHPYNGYRQFAIAGCRDPIYWDFQRRVVAALAKLDIDLLCKPHPEGFFVGQKNPIEALAPTSYRRFEEHLGDADLFLFDAPTSTTFGEALCTNRPVVLLDRAAQYPVNPLIAPELRRRCRLVPVCFDRDGRMRFDTERLAEAVIGGADSADPGYFRGLLAGDV